jgi:hypothetical protein
MKYSKDRKYRDASTVVEEKKITKIKRKIKQKSFGLFKNLIDKFKRN